MCGCRQSIGANEGTFMQGPKDATEATCRAHAHLAKGLPKASDTDFELSKRGFIATIPDARILNEAGHAVWEMSSFAFEDEATPPDTINPSLWRQAKLNKLHGLFKVTERNYPEIGRASSGERVCQYV